MEYLKNYIDILALIDAIDPVKYARTRNFIDGAVTYLSPYISRGVINIVQVRNAVLARGYKPSSITKFLQELAWREYYQRVWWHVGDDIMKDLLHPQKNASEKRVSKAIVDASTGIEVIDEHIRQLYKTGYMHNHMRMYVAGMCCNMAHTYWLQPSRWLYYHLIDGDIASNTCSWQWIAGTFSSRNYIANQENVNRYFHSSQENTFIDVAYDVLATQPVPEILEPRTNLNLATKLPKTKTLSIDNKKPLLLYTSYQLNPEWRNTEDANRVLVLEPSHFEKYPISENVMQFVFDMAANIKDVQMFCGEVNEIPGIEKMKEVYSVEHPITQHFPGNKDPYAWMYPEVTKYYKSFSSFWKQCEKHL